MSEEAKQRVEPAVIRLKVSPEAKERYKDAAWRLRMSLSEWLRRCADAAIALESAAKQGE
jgi:hypothetical protein